MICHSVAVVLTLVQTKQIKINIHKQNNTKNIVQTIQNTVNTYYQNTHTLQAHTYTPSPHTRTRTPTHPHPHTPTHTHTHAHMSGKSSFPPVDYNCNIQPL